MNRAATAAVALFVVVVLVLWVRHQKARAERERRFAEIFATAKAKDEKRIAALRVAARSAAPEKPRACPVKTRVRVVRLDSIAARGGSLHDVNAAIAEEREPSPWATELDVADGRAFLYDFGAERVICIGIDAEDPHGTLVEYQGGP